MPWPQSLRVAYGSPRDKAEISLLLPDHDPDSDHDSDDAITLVPSLRRSSSGCSSRNYIRGGTIVPSHPPGVKRTPPTSPFDSIPNRTTVYPYPNSPFLGSALPPLQLIPTAFLIEASTPFSRVDLGRKRREYTIHHE